MNYLVSPFPPRMREVFLRTDDDLSFRVFLPIDAPKWTEDLRARLKASFRDEDDHERERALRELVKGPVSVRARPVANQDEPRAWRCAIRPLGQESDVPLFACMLLPWLSVLHELERLPHVAETLSCQVFYDGPSDAYGRMRGFDDWCDRIFGVGKVRAIGREGFEWTPELASIWDEVSPQDKTQDLPIVSRLLGGPTTA